MVHDDRERFQSVALHNSQLTFGPFQPSRGKQVGVRVVELKRERKNKRRRERVLRKKRAEKGKRYRRVRVESVEDAEKERGRVRLETRTGRKFFKNSQELEGLK